VKALQDVVRFRLKLVPITALTVGSGRTLGRFDYTLTVNPRSGSPLIRVLDMERFLEDGKIPPEKKIEAIEKRQSATLDRFSRYVLSCAFQEAKEGIELVEFHRDAEGRPLIPASALRGLIRTAVAFAALRREPQALWEGIEGALEGRWRREGAGHRLERRLFGSSQEDPLRALSIGESEGGSNEDLKACEVAVMNLEGFSFRQKLSFFAEALAPSARPSFAFDAAVDRSRLGRRVEDQRSPPPAAPGSGAPAPAASTVPTAHAGGPGGRPAAVDVSGVAAHLWGREEILAALRALSAAIIDGERRFYVDVGARDLGRTFEEALRRADGRIALPFGFGGGWRGKTMGALFGPGELHRLEPLLSPGRPYLRNGPRPIFPKTRRWVLDRFRPAEPFGWTVVE